MDCFSRFYYHELEQFLKNIEQFLKKIFAISNFLIKFNFFKLSEKYYHISIFIDLYEPVKQFKV